MDTTAADDAARPDVAVPGMVSAARLREAPGVPTLGVVISTVRASVAVILGATHVIRLGPRWSRFAKA